MRVIPASTMPSCFLRRTHRLAVLLLLLFSVLPALAREPTLAGVVLGGGIYDLEARYLTMPDDWGAKANVKKEAGTTKEAFLARSALLAKEPIRVPTLFIHGADDPMSPVEGTRRLAARLHEAGTPVEARVYAETAHGVPWREQLGAVVGFLGRVAGGGLNSMWLFDSHR